MHTRVFSILFSLLLFAGTAGAANEVYRWLDDDGQVQYGSVPPQGVDAERVDVRASSGSGEASAESDAGGEAAAPAPGDEDGEAGSANDPAGLRAQCRQTRDDLAVLRESDTNRRFQREDGEVVRFSEEELATEIERREEYVEAYCEALD